MRTPRPIPSPRPLAAAALVALLAGVPAVAHAAAIPRRLDRIESLAEDAYDAALAGKQAAVRNKAEALARLWAAYRPHALAPAPVLEATADAVARLTHAATQGASRLALARAANAVSAHIADLYAPYHPAIPAPVETLDYLGREVALDAMAHDLAGASAHLKTLRATWAPLRVRVVARHGKGTAKAFDRALEAMSAALTAKDPGRLLRAANHTLEVVDRVERVFRGRR